MSHPLLPAVLDLVDRAGHAILPFWRAELAVEEKADASPSPPPTWPPTACWWRG